MASSICELCGQSEEYFERCAKYYLRSIGTSCKKIIREKNIAKGFKGVNIIPYHPEEIGDAITPNYAELPRDRYYVSYQDISSVLIGVDMEENFFTDFVAKAIENYDMQKELVFLIVGLCGHYECFISSV